MAEMKMDLNSAAYMIVIYDERLKSYLDMLSIDNSWLQIWRIEDITSAKEIRLRVKSSFLDVPLIGFKDIST
jgi:hypothetical protein